MSEYKPTEYVVDFGDYRSNRFVELSMALIEHNGARLHERIVRCRDCKFCVKHGCKMYCALNAGCFHEVESDGFCAWAERRKQ